MVSVIAKLQDVIESINAEILICDYHLNRVRNRNFISKIDNTNLADVIDLDINLLSFYSIWRNFNWENVILNFICLSTILILKMILIWKNCIMIVSKPYDVPALMKARLAVV